MNGDASLLEDMHWLRRRLEEEGPIKGVPIPGYPSNFGTLRIVVLPKDRRSDSEDEDNLGGGGGGNEVGGGANGMAETSSPYTDMIGTGEDRTTGIVVGFSLNMANQVVEMSEPAYENMMQGGYASWRDHKYWKLRKGWISYFIDSDVPLLLELVKSIRAMDADGDISNSHVMQKQLSFLQKTLQEARKKLSNYDKEVAKLQLRLQILRDSDEEGLQLAKEAGEEERMKKVDERRARISAGKLAVRTIFSDPTAHTSAIKSLVKLQQQSVCAHGRFEDVVDILNTNRPVFLTRAASNSRDKTVAVSSRSSGSGSTHLANNVNSDRPADFEGIQDLAANQSGQTFSHYLVTIVSEGGRRLEINLDHETRLQDGTGRPDHEASGGLTFDELRDECCKYWGLMEQKFMIQTDYSMPVPPRGSVREHLLHLAVSSKILWGEKPRLIGPRDAFKSIDEDHSGQIDVKEFAMLFRRFSESAQRNAITIFAALDVDHSGEITFAEFVEEWDRILRYLKADIARDRLPLCYLLPKQVVIGSSIISAARGASSNGESHVTRLTNITGADNAVLENASDVGNMQDDHRSEDLSVSTQLGFEMFDKDKNGTISWREFKEVFTTINSLDMGDSEVKKDIRDLFNQTNVSRTGAIDFGEFQKNWSVILTKMADHSRIFGEREILKEIGQNLGVDRIFSQSSERLPKRESTLIREAFIYLLLVIILTICNFENRSILPSYYMIHKFRQEAMATEFGGPIWPSNWRANRHYDRLISYDRDANNENWLPGSMPIYTPLNATAFHKSTSFAKINFASDLHRNVSNPANISNVTNSTTIFSNGTNRASTAQSDYCSRVVLVSTS